MVYVVKPNPFQILQAPPLPCDSCPSACCESAPATKLEVEKIVDYLNARPRLRKKLRRQERLFPKCPFVDMETHKCAVYEVRPKVCQKYGYEPGLECLRLVEEGKLKVAGFRVTALMDVAEDMRKSEGLYAVLGVHITWTSLEEGKVGG